MGRTIIILLLMVSCGHDSDNKCRSGEEMKLRCEAEAVSKWYPVQTPQYEYTQCANQYPIKTGCY